MTIQELYSWAKENNAVNLDISVRTWDGSYSTNIKPMIIKHSDDYTEVQLKGMDVWEK